MSVEVVTKEDLQAFKAELLDEIRGILKENPSGQKKWLKTNEVMELLGMSEVTLQTLRNRKKIPFKKLGGTCYYNAEQLDEFLTNL